MKKILFVCTGNTCRSPMAEAIFNKKAQQKKIEASANSAGISAWEGAGITSNAEDALSLIGIDASMHTASLFDPGAASQYDRIYAMTHPHAQMIEAMSPALRGRVFVLGNGIPDPFGMDIEDYIRCRDEISEAVDLILEELQHDAG